MESIYCRNRKPCYSYGRTGMVPPDASIYKGDFTQTLRKETTLPTYTFDHLTMACVFFVLRPCDASRMPLMLASFVQYPAGDYISRSSFIFHKDE